MTAPLLAVHGWGFNAGFWMPVLDRLPDFRGDCIDMGFYGTPKRPKVPRPLVLAHSMGLAWALANIPRPWAGVLAVNAFPRFTRSPTFVDGVPPRLVERMLARCDEAPQQVAADFLARCGVESPDTSGIDAAPLKDELAWLAKCDERTALRMLPCPVLALAGTNDPIVPQAMSLASFAPETLTLVEGAGHLLPLTHPDWLATQVRLFAARLEA
ncbi:hydrolase or acyltransferase [Paramagnetospirillum caucaseum]|uniref:Hydrolase or acyltransferase n=1 Tax=Paramagnetospirillum caucaseum TaxID=1244869 RepID=M3ABE2_9PROT|nr:alpha/beta hydrolase [Paramagnetospirillum caucaseum]EME69829.1 hydrolase or acyltransferase [Paramagnetospirillum caucaseum]